MEVRLQRAAPTQLVQAFIAKAPVEALDIGVLNRLAGPDEGKAHRPLVGPGVERLALELSAVVHRDRARQPAHLAQPLKSRYDARPRQRGVNLEHEAFAAVIVHDREHPQLPAVDQAIGHVVHRPALVRSRRRGQRQALGDPDALALSLAHHEPLFPIQAVRPLVIHRPALPTKQHLDAPIAVAALLRGELGNAASQLQRGRAPAPIAVQRTRNPHQPASARHAQRALGGENAHRLALSLRAYHFRPTRSFSAEMSSAWSATMRLSLAFSASSSRSRRSSATVMPAYLAFQL